ncbi:MAG TPA: VOC family protein [Chloroflexota bacterium]
MFKDVYHIGYLTRDKGAAIAFYRATFGGELKLETRNPDGAQLAFLRVGNTEIELIQPADATSLQDKPLLVLDHIGYVVDSVDDELARLEAKGIKRLWPEPRVNAEGARLIYLDPATLEGLRMHLTERPR